MRAGVTPCPFSFPASPNDPMPSTQSSLQVVILAAGQGKRMNSDLPKVLHPLAGRPLLSHVLDTARLLAPSQVCVVVGHGADRVRQAIGDAGVAWATQAQQLGTGHAVMQALPHLAPGGTVLVLYGDVPLIASGTLRSLVDAAAAGHVALLTQELAQPKGYGRIVRNGGGRVARIVEEKDANESERAIREVNTGILALPRANLEKWLAQLRNENSQGEYYLTDVVAVLHDAGYGVVSMLIDDARETQGVNDRVQLAAAEAELRRRTNESLLRQGVTMIDPDRTYVDATVKVANDVTLFPGTLLQGQTLIGSGAEIGPDTRLVDCVVGEGAVVEFSVGRDAEIGAGARVGPFAALQPGSHVGAGTFTGPFYTASSNDDSTA